MSFLDPMSDEQLYFLACLIIFIGLMLAIYLGNELLEWAARRREEATAREHWDGLKKRTEPRKRPSSCVTNIEKRSSNDLLMYHTVVHHNSKATTK